MNFYYCLFVFTILLLTASLFYAFMKKKNLADKTNTIHLVICTVLSMVSATLIPIFAKLMVKGLYFTIFGSLVLSFMICTVLSASVFFLIQLIVKKREVHENDNICEGDDLEAESLQEKTSELETAFVQEQKQKQEQKQEKEEAAYVSTDIGFEEATSTIVTEAGEINSETVADLLDQALASKKNHEYQSAISCYETAIAENPDTELLTWIIIDLCSLYKMTNHNDLIHNILDSECSKLLNMEIKKDISLNI